jgi:hypothetical protein
VVDARINKKASTNQGLRSGGDEGDRTLDLRIANATLSQLSYVPRNAYYSGSRRE